MEGHPSRLKSQEIQRDPAAVAMRATQHPNLAPRNYERVDVFLGSEIREQFEDLRSDIISANEKRDLQATEEPTPLFTPQRNTEAA